MNTTLLRSQTFIIVIILVTYIFIVTIIKENSWQVMKPPKIASPSSTDIRTLSKARELDFIEHHSKVKHQVDKQVWNYARTQKQSQQRSNIEYKNSLKDKDILNETIKALVQSLPLHRVSQDHKSTTHDVSTNKIMDFKLNNAANTGPPIAIIMAYMHTGSSYTANLLREYPGSVLYAEPLEILRKCVLGSQGLHFLNGTVRYPTEAHFQRMATEIFNSILSCKLEDLDVKTLSKVSYNILETREIPLVCKGVPRLKKNGHIPYNNIDINPSLVKALKHCIPTVTSICSKASLLAIKSIRMNITIGKNTLDKFENAKIIHLLRDPRSMLDSNVRRNEMGVRNVSVFSRRAEMMCGTIQRDVRDSYKLKQSYPGKISTVRYEDMTKDPVGVAKDMFKFFDIPFTDIIKKRVDSISVNNENNSTIRAAVWRSHISQEHLDLVNQHCGEVYKDLRYPKFKTLNEVQNLSNPDTLLDL